jgi:mannose-6-phosphate isomerase-like protein (cupin superfamily)
MVEKLSVDEFQKIGKVVKENDVYTVIDVSKLENLVVSKTILHPGKETGGHSHSEADEVYFFVKGNGKMDVGGQKSDVKADDIILIPRGSFHKVFNTSESDLVFVCVFEKYGDRN